MNGLLVTVRFRSDFHVGSGLGRGREVDSAVLRDDKDRVYLPGSTVKGLARTALRRLLAAGPLQRVPVCLGTPYEDGETAESGFSGRTFRGLCGVNGPGVGTEGEEVGEDFDPPCVLCRVFGNTGRQAGVAFTNAYPVEEPSPGPEPSRDPAGDRLGTLSRRAMRSRRTGTTEEKALLTEELAAARTFELELEPTGAAELDDRHWLLLAAALRTIGEMGGGRRRGHGACEIEVEFDGGRWDGYRLPVPREAREPDESRDTPENALGHLLRSGEFPAPPEPEVRAGPDGPATRGPTVGSPASTGDRESKEERSEPVATLLVIAEAREPLALARRPDAGNKLDAQPFVPGSSVRGALAWRMIRERGLGTEAHKDATFVRCFLDERLRFAPLYPAACRDGRLTVGSPVPRSVVTCRDRPGFRPDGGHGAVDRLVAGRDALSFDCRAGASEDDDGSGCGGRMVPRGGFLAIEGQGEHGPRYRGVEVTGRTRYQTEVEDASGRAAESQLYGARLVEAGTVFAGYVWGPRGDLDLVRELLSEDEAPEIRVGRARTRGRGRLALHLPAPEPREEAFPWLHPEADRRIAHQQEDGGEGARRSFTLTLHSDLIALDSWLHPVTELDGPALWRLLGGEEPSPLRLEWAYADTRRVHGWLGKPGLPRSADRAIVRGSSFRYVVDGSRESDAAVRDLSRRLRRAERRGLGLRRGEGFGAVVVNHPVHRDLGRDERHPARAGSGDQAPSAAPTPVEFRTGFEPPRPKTVRRTEEHPRSMDTFYRELAGHLGASGVRFLRWAGCHPESAVPALRHAASVSARDSDEELPGDWRQAAEAWEESGSAGDRRRLLWWGIARVLEEVFGDPAEDPAVAERIGSGLIEVARETGRRLETPGAEADR